MSTTTSFAPSYEARYRLTRRGRFVVFVLGFLVVLAIGIAFAGGSMATGEKEATETVVVAPGDTLWDIAAGVADDGDVRAMMAHIEDLNSLDSVSLDAGQRLEVPAE